jgi:hypothetical protein
MQIAMGIRPRGLKGGHIACGALSKVPGHWWDYTDGYDAEYSVMVH